MNARVLLVVPLVLATAGCIGGSNTVRYMRDKADVPSLVMILPPDNKTSDGAAPDTVRRATAEMLLGLGMIPVTSPAQDEQLEKIMAEGKPLEEVEPQRLADALGVDGLIYTTINQFNDINLVVYAQRVVEATLKFVDRSGNKIWEIKGTGYNRKVSTDISELSMNLGSAAMHNIKAIDIQGQLEKALKIHLLQEAQQMTGFMSAKLPDWPKSDKPAVDLAAAEAAAKAVADAKAAAAPPAKQTVR